MPEENDNPNLFLIEHRRVERRIEVFVPVEVTKIDDQGRDRTERTFIEDVSDFGCRFSTRRSVQKGDTVSVKLLGPDGDTFTDEKPRLYEIMWVAPKKRGSTVGARLLQGEKLARVRSLPENEGTNRDPK